VTLVARRSGADTPGASLFPPFPPANSAINEACMRNQIFATLFFTQGAPAGLVNTFIEYASPSQVTDLIVSHDFVPYLD
jgi:hypothetical protein